MIGLGALSLSACSSDEPLNNHDSDSNNVQAYMTLQLVGPESRVNTKTTAGVDGTEEGTAVQNKITSATILLCDPTSHQVQHVYAVSELKTSANNGATTQPIKTTTGTFDVYVIANPGNVSLTVGVDVTGKTIEGVTENLMKSAYASDNTFIMFNESNGSDDVNGSSITIKAENDYENPATCNAIKLDRLAAQIRSKAASSLTITDITGKYSFVTAATLKGYKLLNGATKVNLQQHWNNTLAGQGTVAPWINLLKTPELAAGTNAGGSDYYNHLTDFRTINKTTATSGESYSVVKDLYATINPYETTALGSIFCMENSPLSFSGATAFYGNTTGLVYQFQTTVTGSDAKAGANCFYAYNGEYFATLSALQTRYPNAFDAATGTDAASKLAAAQSELVTAYASSDKQTEISNFRVKYKVKVYTDGIMYYTYFIKDKNYKQGTAGNEENYYSVMRNTIYDLTVKSLKRIGTDIPGGWNPDVDPEDPVDPTNVYMVVEAKVNNWVLSTEEIDLK